MKHREVEIMMDVRLGRLEGYVIALSKDEPRVPPLHALVAFENMPCNVSWLDSEVWIPTCLLERREGE